ncbi:dienelactone hydrolase family protein [Kutzneria viridogrisea]|uniref:Carboxymethylenebutenolidase n=2 Tax=Kutzneria TaxID=43356 RepID=A0ABR6BWL2_9PSEU|nr:dienelactone hydrolase family protein [Kutzneria albida]AHH94025.1 putative carboxymethylenebutenolidase precursor (dienelactone hydrolase) (DLH) [Kutzneria albida DSM 43870]MBA8930969.1 carboxymethylenebutenolidase [Kutzneria viridogrisea]
MDIRIPTSSGPINAHLAVPLGEGPWPGVVVIPDVTGLHDDVRAIAGRFATAGYLAVVPDLYSRGGFLRCVRTVFSQLNAGRGQAFDDIEAARQFLVGRADCTGKVGVAGFCLGGGFALLTAPRGFDASAPYYGMLPEDRALLDGACPVVASFGRKDFTLKGAAATLERELTARGVPHDVKEYAEAGHSFANRLPAAPLFRVLGFGYHHDSSEDAWRRVLTFFGEHLSVAETS